MRGWRTVGSELVRAPNFRICWQRHSDSGAMSEEKREPQTESPERARTARTRGARSWRHPQSRPSRGRPAPPLSLVDADASRVI